MARRRGCVDQARGRHGEHRQLRARIRRLRRRRTGIRMGRLQGCRRERQDARDARQRSACPRSRQRRRARPEDVRRQGDDLLRALDVQVRDREGKRGRRCPAHSRDGAGRLSVRCRAVEGHRAIRSRHARQEPRPGIDRRMDLARTGQETASDGRSGLRHAQETGGDPRFQARSTRRHCVDDAAQHAAHDRLSQRRRQTGGFRSGTEGRVRRSTPRIGITWASGRR